jgi:hypothetical protein
MDSDPLSIILSLVASLAFFGAAAIMIRSRDLRRRRSAHSDLDLYL